MVNKKRNIITQTNPEAPARVAGIDGCRAGWIALTLGPEGAAARIAMAETWSALALEGHDMLAVDMPIGLADTGPRACDIAARQRLPRARKSSVFPPPRRAMLACASWAEANALGRAREGTGLSRQAWNLAAKIRELDRALGPGDQDRVREVHPELVFQRLNEAASQSSTLPASLPSKKTAAGRAARLALLERAGIPGLPGLLARVPRSGAQPDDLLDAAACALAARDMLAGRARRLPASEPPRDARGLRMEIWF